MNFNFSTMKFDGLTMKFRGFTTKFEDFTMTFKDFTMKFKGFTMKSGLLIQIFNSEIHVLIHRFNSEFQFLYYKILRFHYEIQRFHSEFQTFQVISNTKIHRISKTKISPKCNLRTKNENSAQCVIKSGFCISRNCVENANPILSNRVEMQNFFFSKLLSTVEFERSEA